MDAGDISSYDSKSTAICRRFAWQSVEEDEGDQIFLKFRWGVFWKFHVILTHWNVFLNLPKFGKVTLYLGTEVVYHRVSEWAHEKEKITGCPVKGTEEKRRRPIKSTPRPCFLKSTPSPCWHGGGEREGGMEKMMMWHKFWHGGWGDMTCRMWG